MYAKATRQLSEFDELYKKYKIALLDDLQIIEKAAEIHADLKRKGTPIQDADVFNSSYRNSERLDFSF